MSEHHITYRVPLGSTKAEYFEALHAAHPDPEGAWNAELAALKAQFPPDVAEEAMAEVIAHLQGCRSSPPGPRHDYARGRAHIVTRAKGNRNYLELTGHGFL